MLKRAQNKVAESRLTLPTVAAYALVVWLLCGAIEGRWLLQLCCFAATTYLMVELNNRNALIRIYSRTVSSSFLVLSCAACFLFPSLEGNFMQLCMVAAVVVACRAYQNKEAAGVVYYAFALTGMASMAFVHVFFFLPLFWLVLTTQLQAMSWRTFVASLLGLATPYWFAACWLLFQQDFTPLGDHMAALAHFEMPFAYGTLTVGQWAALILTVAVATTGIVHFLRTSYNDKFRVRQLYGMFIYAEIYTLAFLLVQPQHYDMLLRLLIVFAAPLVAHYISLTATRLTNFSFYLFATLALLITAYNVWSLSLLF